MQVSRMVNVTTYVFADHLRGTPFLNWWFRAMVSFCLCPPCVKVCVQRHIVGLLWYKPMGTGNCRSEQDRGGRLMCAGCSYWGGVPH